MKNPFEKENHNGLIAAAIIGGFAAAALAYLFLTEEGEERFAEIKHKVKDLAKDIASGIVSDKTGISKKNVKSVADHVVK
ncbi:hypothetical protein [Mucilaginibacter aquariorum]|uniref:YtxH domain-containing protein n=1 Tax=Mucilaginibacter aquariorum TaxID=2967225 RepID=A0ABT1SXL4_9SPHI|nr:hypothetical protein [Mucilaginibacter aquariorum]MCQ6957079.1 hypothetical protein [Mucilaginibacter aquariorum]